MSGGSLIKGVLGLADKYLQNWLPSYEDKQKELQEWFTLYKIRRGLDRQQIERIQRMEPEQELMAELPRFFAEDLNLAMTMEGAPARVLLFFDTHEAFWGQQRDLANEIYFERDDRFRRMLVSCCYIRMASWL